ncbi:MAG: hypothetical protein J5574_04065 [Lachnospiraceae bacterium]|nr:hypothetical protein [Lachnospiraceae bacterium]
MIRKHFLAATLLAALIALPALEGCSATVTVPENAASTANEEQQTNEPEKEEDKKEGTKEEKETEDTEMTEDMYKEDSAEVFAEMSDWLFIFSSGAGGWETTLSVKPDGTFTGRYHDSEMGSTGPGYPGGTLYECSFSGKFSDYVRSAGPLMHSLSIESIKYEKDPDTEEIKDDILYKYTTPYGIEGLEKVTAYEPLVFLEAGAVTSALNEEEMSWVSPTHFGTYLGDSWDYVEDKPEELPYAVLLNSVDSYAFYAESKPGKNKMFLVNKAKLPGVHNTECTINGDGTYYCVDENDDASFRVISTCFKADKEYDAYSDPEKLVNDSVKRIYKEHAPNPEDIHITSPKEASEMMYPSLSVCGYHTAYAFWYPDKNSYASCVDCRFLVVNGYETGASFVYAYIIETEGGDGLYPDASFAGKYITSLTLTGKSDELSSAGKGEGAVRSILTVMKTPEDGIVAAREEIWVSESDTDLIKKYHLEDADFNDDYEMVSPSNGFHMYGLAEKSYTPFYIDYPKDKIHSYQTAYDLKEVMGEPSEDTAKLMQLYLNRNDEVVYAYEVYTP